MAGVAFAIDHRWALDIGYRALYMDGASTSDHGELHGANGSTPDPDSTATLDGAWEHQVRVGLRLNIW